MPKPKKKQGHPVTSRPLCLLSILGKVLERKANMKLSVLIALEIKNALNFVPWREIDWALKEKQTPVYLRAMTRSVPQGSVLGPVL